VEDRIKRVRRHRHGGSFLAGTGSEPCKVALVTTGYEALNAAARIPVPARSPYLARARSALRPISVRDGESDR
jgi:hypothetical protein